jgi:hypothetical protein
MNEHPDIDAALHAAVDGLSNAEQGVFSDEFVAWFSEGAPTRAECAPALECAWQMASSRLLSDPLDPIGEAWARFAAVLIAQRDGSLRGEPHAQA